MDTYERYDAYAGRLLADRYRLPRTPSEEFELVESRAFDTVVGQEVLVRQVPLPEVIDAEMLDGDGRSRPARRGMPDDRATREPGDPMVRRAVEAATAASRLADHPRLDQVFDVFVQGDGLWIVSELVAARPLAAVLAEHRLTPYRAAEVAADLLAALRIVHAHGWTHRNLTARTVMICDDGRAVLTGLAVGAAEEALCGYDPLPGGTNETAVGLRAQTPAAEGWGAHPQPGAATGERPLAAGPEADRQGLPAGPERPGAHGPLGWHPQGHGGGAGSGGEGASPFGWHAEGQGGGQGRPEGLHDLEAERPGEYGPLGWQPQGQGPAPAPGPGGPQAPDFDGWDDELPGPGTFDWHTQGQGVGLQPDGPPWTNGAGEPPPAEPSWRAAHRRGTGAETQPESPDRPRRNAPTGPSGSLPAAYQRWDTGAVQRVDASASASEGEDEGQEAGGGAADLVARMRQQGGGRQPDPAQDGHDGQDDAGALPASWDFEGGGRSPDRADDGGNRDARTAEERAARSGAIAAYRAGTQAAANARRGSGGGPAALPGPGHPDFPARTGWEPEPRHSPGRPQPQPGPPHQPAPQHHHQHQLPPQSQSQPAPQVAERYRGPDSALAAERARQARMTTVGAVTERWAPEQAGPVYEHWRLAPPVGPAADFWALGALLFRAVQGYPAYPEESAAELTQAVCSEQPAFAEDCGALRPIVESLLRQDPTERPSAEELRGWLRSLLRSAPEPEVGRNTVTAPPPALEPGRPSDPRRLPVVRRRGVLVGPLRRRPRARSRPRARAAPGPRRLGRLLLSLVLLGLAGAVVYAMAFMPGKSNESSDSGEQGNAGTGGQAADPGPVSPPPAEGENGGGTGGAGGEDPDPEPSGGGNQPTDDGGGQDVPEGFVARQDAEGFSLVVPEGFSRQGMNDAGQVIYADGPLEIVVVPGRDSVEEFGDDLLDYQQDREPELEAYRADEYSSFRDIYEIGVGDSAMVTGVFVWREGGEQLVAFNQVVVIEGHYHVVLVRGPASEEARLNEINETTAGSYTVTG
ncbi:protein kinase [Streptomyces sp. 6N223]|uniref:protein kinase n=1 Tax=Streptomyces sp. 6N223 TaxID=3457412 RepID=UPI003FD06D0B